MKIEHAKRMEMYMTLELRRYHNKKLWLDGIRDILIAGMFSVWFYSEVLK